MASNSIAGLQGLRNSIELAQDASSRIARSTTTAGGSLQDVAEAAVNLKSAELGAKASARVIEADARTTGSLIDILA